ncbi:hypothetical protein PIB30_064058 [Stylosanthes scabra]|uniref:Uncharacterized protein n=1 Tax=Stylosanthes scabra TaxID=79078 RepID=A0ABU6RLI8_9FABA|nr:hypothetical protein [Stylosanthes scabra]
MEAFYASIEAETTPLSALRELPKTRPSRETLKAWQVLRELVGKKFSNFYDPGTERLMRDTLKHLLKLPQAERVSLKTMSILQQLLLNFNGWILEHDKAINKVKSVDECVSKAEKASQDLNANVREFKETEMDEKALGIKLESLVQKRRELEEEIKATNAKIDRLMSKMDSAAKRKREVFENGKVLRSKRDGLMNRVPPLKAERESAFRTETKIEFEWSKLGKQIHQLFYAGIAEAAAAGTFFPPGPTLLHDCYVANLQAEVYLLANDALNIEEKEQGNLTQKHP